MTKIVKAVHGLRKIRPDPDFETSFTKQLKARCSQEELIELYGQFALGDGDFNSRMRRVLWRALAQKFGHGVSIGSGAGFQHAETFQIGHNVFIGSQTYIQGRAGGRCVIGNHVWIGPQSYFAASDLVLGDYVGWGPGAKVLCSEHTGHPLNIPIIQTPIRIAPVRVGAWADIGTNAVLLPGVHIGKGSIVGAGAVVTEDVAPYAVVAGVPARFMRWRKDRKVL